MNYLKNLMFVLVVLSFVPFAAAELAPETVPFEQLSPRDALERFSRQLNPEKSSGETIVAGFSFTDLNEDYGIRVTFGKVKFSEGMPEDPHFSISISNAIWQEIVHGKISILDAITSNTPGVSVFGSKITFLKFLDLFDKTPDTKVQRY